jgi:outer membrane protein assembly factor BamA
VQEIKVQYAGPVTAAIENAVANMETRVGQRYDVKSVEGDIRNLSATRNVSNVRIFGEAVTDGVRVIVVVQTKSATLP